MKFIQPFSVLFFSLSFFFSIFQGQNRQNFFESVSLAAYRSVISSMREGQKSKKVLNLLDVETHFCAKNNVHFFDIGLKLKHSSCCDYLFGYTFISCIRILIVRKFHKVLIIFFHLGIRTDLFT